EALVDLRPAGVVYPCGDRAATVVLLCDAGTHDVGVVAVGHRDEDIGLLDARLLQDVPIEPGSDEGLAFKTLVEVLEGRGVLVDDGDGEVALSQGIRQLSADPSATHDDRVHGENDTRVGGNIYVSQIGAHDFLTKSLRAGPL